MPHRDRRRSIFRLGRAVLVTMACIACNQKPPADASSAAPSAAPLPTSQAAGQPPPLPGQREGDYTIRDFRFASGESIPELRLHYTTLGKPHEGANGAVDNAVLLLHGTTGRGRQFLTDSFRSAMFGAGQPLDTSKYYVIMPDNVGAGQSSKPSEGLHARFPHYAYADIVELQHRLVTEKLGISHLRLLLGTSMGGMHTWLWAEKYPDMMDAAVPIACEPTRILGRNLLWRRLIVEATKGDPQYNGGEYTAQPNGFLAMMPLFYMMTDNPGHLQQAIPSIEKATAFIHPEKGFGDRSGAQLDANNLVYALDASRDYDPEPDLQKIKTKVLAINFADDELNAVSLGNLARLVPRVPGARFVIVPAGERTRGHMTQLLASVWQEHLIAFLRELN
ncbi:alpha/beta fold hydrolase [Pendulispora brunnea]|uniref:Alpha/beta fold hydrolase n=1 Tax=Pendulispora brunnea TaxID=2905690 RepID=A0ABZ2KA36_9BACT